MRNRRRACLKMLVLVLPATLGLACIQRDWSVCSPQDQCQTGYICTADWKCAPDVDAGADALLVVAADGAMGIDGTVTPEVAPGPAVGQDGGEPDSASMSASPDAQAEVAFDVPLAAVLDAPATGGLADATAADAPPIGSTADAAGTCSRDTDCLPQNPLCLGNQCTKCSGDNDCAGRPGTPACATGGLCVACTANRYCTGAATTCDTSTNQCVGCVKRSDCAGACQTCTNGVCTAVKSHDDTGACPGTCDATGACKSTQGQACQAASDCAGVTFCSDGHCCDKACTGSCEACDIAGSLGTCTTLAANAEPNKGHTACVASDPICAGKCNGVSATCSYPVSTTACGTASCTGQIYQAAGTCSNGDCAKPAAQTCTNVCVLSAGGCKDCTTSGQCTDPTKPICQGDMCVACTAGSSTVCGDKDSSKPTCDTGTGKCVECTTSNQCATASKPICGNGQTCVACGDAGAPTSGCSAKNATLAACSLTSGTCVECTANSHCTSSGKPVCNTSTNLCVQCTDSSQCSGATPICSSNTCVACTADAQCVAKLGQNPGVCMSHQDGRCATDAETIYAEETAGCSTTSGGTATAPYCDSQTAISALSATRRLIVVRGTVGGFSYYTPGLQLTVVGQLDGNIYPTGVVPNCVAISNGADLYMRDLVCSTNYNVAAVLAQSATLHLLRMVLFDSAGGVLLDGSNFEIVDTILSGNYKGEFGTNLFGGIYVNNPPTTGLKRLERVTFKDNNFPTDITCTAPTTGVGVYAPDNGVDATCGITPCTPASANCGSSLTWVSPG